MLVDDQTLALMIADACLNEKAFDVVVLDVRELTVIADYFVLASGRSPIQVRSIIDGVERILSEEKNIKPLRREGHQQGLWAVLDYNSVLLHVFRQQEREYYNLENLWGDARQIPV
ncbi:MAG: ribosome silencing factor [Syntrophomonadaceae bacterium]|jgi:ribosome-associated protein